MMSWVGAKTAVKVSPVLIPIIGLVDVEWAMSVAFGMLAGFSARIGMKVRENKTSKETWRDTVGSIFILGSSLLATLYVARMMEADNLTVAVIGCFAVTHGVDVIDIFKGGKKGDD